MTFLTILSFDSLSCFFPPLSKYIGLGPLFFFLFFFKKYRFFFFFYWLIIINIANISGGICWFNKIKILAFFNRIIIIMSFCSFKNLIIFYYIFYLYGFIINTFAIISIKILSKVFILGIFKKENFLKILHWFVCKRTLIIFIPNSKNLIK